MCGCWAAELVILLQNIINTRGRQCMQCKPSTGNWLLAWFSYTIFDFTAKLLTTMDWRSNVVASALNRVELQLVFRNTRSERVLVFSGYNGSEWHRSSLMEMIDSCLMELLMPPFACNIIVNIETWYYWKSNWPLLVNISYRNVKCQ